MNRLNRLLKNFNSISIPGFTDTQPSAKKASKKISFFVFTKRRGAVLVVALVLVAAMAAFSLIKPNEKVNELYPGISPSPTAQATNTPETVGTQPSPSAKPTSKPSPVASPTNTPTPSPTSSASPSPTPTTAPSPVVSPSIAPAPSPSPEPPVMKITFPTDGQQVVFTSPNQTFCMVDVPVSGTYGEVQRKVSLNEGAWTDYAPTSTLCYEPKQGDNTIKAQYKNKYGLESSVYMVKFSFMRDYTD